MKRQELNYFKFKEFLINLGFITEQSKSSSIENTLTVDFWNFASTSSTSSEERVVFLADFRVLVMAILRLNDGKTFSETSDN